MAVGFALIGFEAILRVRAGEFHFENYPTREINLFRSAYPTQYDPMLGWIPKNGASGKENVWKTTITVQEYGIRSNDKRFASRISSSRPILAVGDSFTFGDEVSDDETWPAILELLLQRKVINAGVFGYGLDQSFLRAKQLMALNRPDTLVFSFSEDDISRCEFSQRTGAAKPYFRVSGTSLQLENIPVPTPIVQKPMDHFRKVFGYSFLVHRIMMKLFPHYWMQGQSHNTKVHSQGEKVACLLLEQVDDIAREFKVEHVYILGQYSKAPSQKEINRMARVMSCVDDQFVKVIDLQPVFLEVKQQNQKKYDGFFKFHMTPEGNYFVARHLQTAMDN